MTVIVSLQLLSVVSVLLWFGYRYMLAYREQEELRRREEEARLEAEIKEILQACSDEDTRKLLACSYKYMDVVKRQYGSLYEKTPLQVSAMIGCLGEEAQ